jgi:hypothetical protein
VPQQPSSHVNSSLVNVGFDRPVRAGSGSLDASDFKEHRSALRADLIDRSEFVLYCLPLVPGFFYQKEAVLSILDGRCFRSSARRMVAGCLAVRTRRALQLVTPVIYPPYVTARMYVFRPGPVCIDCM